MKLYDFDGMFDKKLSEYIAKNVAKYSEQEWEDMIPVLYKRFGDTFIKSVGSTPNAFYAAMSDGELITALKTHLKRGVPVPEFLCSAIEGRNMSGLLMPLLDGTADEREYAVNLLGADDAAIKKYMSMLANSDCDEEFKSVLCENIKQKADLVASQAVEYYEKGIEREFMLEIMSRTVIPDEKVFKILVSEFRSDPENIPLHASYLAAYGDTRALEYLLDKIDEEGISFIEYKELLIAIESLGGSYDKPRDFTSDPYYKLITDSTPAAADIFKVFNPKEDK